MKLQRSLKPTPGNRRCSEPDDAEDPVYTDTLSLDISTVEPSLAGPEPSAGQDIARRHENFLQRKPSGKRRKRGFPARGKRAL